MMYGRRKSDPGVVATKSANNAEPFAAEPVEPRTGTKGNVDRQSTGLGKCVTSAGPHTTGCKAKEEGTVHHASPPRQRRPTQAVVLRTQEGRGTWGRRPGMAGLRDKPRGQPRGLARSGPSGSVSGTAQSATIHTKSRWTAASDCGLRLGRQNRPKGGRRGAKRDLRGRLPRFLVWVPAQTQPARCAGCTVRRDRHQKGELDIRSRHPKLLR